MGKDTLLKDFVAAIESYLDNSSNTEIRVNATDKIYHVIDNFKAKSGNEEIINGIIKYFNSEFGRIKAALIPTNNNLSQNGKERFLRAALTLRDVFEFHAEVI